MTAQRPQRRRPRRGAAEGARAPRRRPTTPSPARLVALRVVERVERTGAYADLALHAAFERASLPARERAFATELAYGTLRWRGRLDFLLTHVLDRALEKLEPPVTSLLRLGAYQIGFMEGVPAPVAVAETVRLSQTVGLERASGLVNAVLRRLAERVAEIRLPELGEDPLGHLSHALSLPSWIAERWLERFGPEEAAALALASNQPPPRTVRVNRTQTSRDELLSELRERFPDASPCQIAQDGVVLGRRGDPARDPAFLAGRFTIQDEASQVVVELLDPQPGERILDACAAPGAKATATAERVGPSGSVLGLDRHARRLGLLERDARRLGLTNLSTRVIDSGRPFPADFAPGSFDRVLIDAPCSGLGTLRRNPDARWRLRPDALERLAAAQWAILTHVAPLLRVGGSLVYSTCTLAPEENEAVIERFLANQTQFRVADTVPPRLASLRDASGALRLYPHRHDSDAFYMTRLERSR